LPTEKLKGYDTNQKNSQKMFDTEDNFTQKHNPNNYLNREI